MKFIPEHKVEEMLRVLKKEITESILNAIERPLTTADYEVLGYSNRKALQNEISRGNIPHHKVGGKIYFYLSEVNQFIKSNGCRRGNAGFDPK